MKYCLAAEGGGSKLLFVLYDETFRVLGTQKMCGVNELYHPVEAIERETYETLARLLPPDCKKIERADCALVGNLERFLRILGERAEIGEAVSHGEGQVALAVTGEPYGIVAQAGTGSDAFFLQKDKDYVIGGWGAQLGDEGSGYDVGIMTIRAAIYGEDGRGPGTPLTELVKQHYGVKDLWDLVTRFAGNPKARGEVAGVTYALAAAAAQGDPVSLDIYARAAHSMSNQVLTAIHRNNGVWEGPIVTSGGVWKGSHVMFDVFRDDVLQEYPQANVIFPEYEPLAGCISLGLLARGYKPEEVRRVLNDNFAFLRIKKA